MIEYESNIRRQVAHDRAERVAEEYRRAQRVRPARIPVAIRRRIASVASAARRRRAAHDPAYRH
jgi:hypothetical protein